MLLKSHWALQYVSIKIGNLKTVKVKAFGRDEYFHQKYTFQRNPTSGRR